MKVSARLTLLLTVFWVLHSQAEEVLPPRFNFDRYSKMVEKSPFALATAVAAPAATPDFAKDLYIANVAHSSEGDMVTLASTSDHNFKKYLTTKEPVDGYSIANIEWSDKVGATKVTISKDGNFATITFNQALLSQGAPTAGAGGRGFAPPMPPANPLGVTNPAMKLPPGVPAEVQQLLPSAQNLPKPHSRGLIQRNSRGSASKGAAPPPPSKQ
jgi:hypothetical protein